VLIVGQRRHGQLVTRHAVRVTAPPRVGTLGRRGVVTSVVAWVGSAGTSSARGPAAIVAHSTPATGMVKLCTPRTVDVAWSRSGTRTWYRAEYNTILMARVAGNGHTEGRGRTDMSRVRCVHRNIRVAHGTGRRGDIVPIVGR
jgi:hypothetical protein